MAVRRPSVEDLLINPIIAAADEKIGILEQNNWDFRAVPEAFARNPAADVLAKEIVHIHDGRTMTRIGKLYMGGVGTHFNLMGPINSDASFQVAPARELDEVNAQIRSRGLGDLKEFRALGKAQPVDFYNYTLFYTLRDLIFWVLVHDAGIFPSSLEHMVRHFAAGHLIQNSLYAPRHPSKSKRTPAFMMSVGLRLQFPTKVVEWMDKPLYGGLAQETIHVETLLTLKRSNVSHPYLQLEREGKVKLHGRSYYMRRFVGTTPKEGLRGPGVPAEGAK